MIRSFGLATILMTAGLVINKLGLLVITVLLARLSSTEIYGTFALLRSTVNMVETTLSSSVTPVLIRVSGQEFGKQDSFGERNFTLLVISLALVSVITVPLWLLAEPISIVVFSTNNPKLIYWGLALLIATNGSGLIASLLITGRATSYLPIASIAATPIAILYAYLAIPDAPLYAAIMSMVLLHCVEFAVKLALAIGRRIIRVGIPAAPSSEMLSVFSGSLSILILSSGLNALTFWTLRLLLVDASGVFTPLAHFDVAFQYFAVEMMMLNSAVAIFQSRSASSPVVDTSQMSRIYRAGIQISLLITVGACAANLIFADLLIGLYGAEYDPQLLRVLTAALPPYAVAIFFNRSYVNQGKQGILLLVTVTSSIAALLFARLYMKTAHDLAASFTVYFGVSSLVYIAYAIWQRREVTKE